MNWKTLVTCSDQQIIDWAAIQPWAQAMAQCQQDQRWHAEGDVWTHAKFVCHEILGLDCWAALPREDQVVLLFTGLLHDAAKPLTTVVDPDTGSVSSPKHAVKGEQLARRVLRELGCELATREKIAKLVRYHGRPVFLTERENPVAEVVRHSWLTDNRLLYNFAIADARGRDTDSCDRPIENLEYWKLLSIENDCWSAPWNFTTDHQRFKFLFDGEQDLSYVPHEDFSCEVTMLAGLPGSGKDTWACANASDLAVVSLDEVRQKLKIDPTENQGEVAQWAKEECRRLLRASESFVFNATKTMFTTRQRWIRLFNDYRARVKVVYVEPDLEVVLKQNRSRESAVPENVIRRLADRLEPPTWAECHELVWET